MKNLIPYTFCVVLLFALCGCSDSLDIKQSYAYKVETLPLPKSLAKGETVFLKFSIIREGHYDGTSYKFRYFQPDGEGTLTYGEKTVQMNSFQPLSSDLFTLAYTCQSEGQQELDFVFEDNFGQRVDYSIEFSGEDSSQTDSLNSKNLWVIKLL